MIDGHAFDFGVYVLITSIDPLRFVLVLFSFKLFIFVNFRIYRWTGNVFLRFCPEPYYPFDPKIVDKYVVSETHKPFWEMPSLADLTEKLNFSAQDAFNFHLGNSGHDVEAFWNQVDDAIVSITLGKATHIARHTNYYKTDHEVDFFELLRFDFVMKEEEEGKLQLYLMEVKKMKISEDFNEILSIFR